MQTGFRYSLIVMTRNRPGPLARCLGSIDRFRWSGQRPEVIIVDDGSEPPAKARPSDFPELDLITVRQEHGGVAAARNAGIERATGDFIAFIADDYVLPESYLVDVHQFYLDHPEAQVISHHIDPRGALLLAPVQRLYFELALGQEVPAEQAGREIVHSFTLPASRAAMFRREVFERVGRFDERLRVGEDGEFGQRLARAGVPVYLFSRKRIAHFDAQNSIDYFRQRLRYGRSYIRSGVSGLPLQQMDRRAFLARMRKMFRDKLRLWWRVSGSLGLRRRFVAMSPFLMLFLGCFYYGAYAEFRELEKTGSGE